MIAAKNAVIIDALLDTCHDHRMNSGDHPKYIWQSADWPQWTFSTAALMPLLSEANLERGKLLGAIQILGFKLAAETSLRTLTSDVVKSSEIEGEHLNNEMVRSSLARKLGLNIGGLLPSSRQVDGVVEMILDATQNHAYPLTDARLFGWHAALFPNGYSGMHQITTAAYRTNTDGPMQVVSGSIGHETVHYEAPSASILAVEMQFFLDWFNQPPNTDPLLKAGLAHLWFVSLHPFEDGNGRIARAIGDMALAKADQSTQRFYSLSTQIQLEREDYYLQLEMAQKGTMDITNWLHWFLSCLLRAIQQANQDLKGVVYLTQVSQRSPNGALNERQIKMLDKLMHNFEGHLTTGKWATLTKCSTDTALRDITELVTIGVLAKAGESKRTAHYVLTWE